jgi:hypothetical protein
MLSLIVRLMLGVGLSALFIVSIYHAVKRGEINAAGTIYKYKKQRILFTLIFIFHAACSVGCIWLVFNTLAMMMSL